MNPRTWLARVAAMDAAELRFRGTCEARKAGGRLRFAVAAPAWRRRDLTGLLDAAAGPLVGDARDAAARRDHAAAHRALARHFAARPARWPLAASARLDLSKEIRRRFPTAASDARDRADRIVEGHYDLLGYRDLALGSIPDWHADVVNGRRAPRGYWSTIPFLDAASGDHKVIWEVNRHQHFLTLGTAAWLTGDARYRRAAVAHLEDWLRMNPPLDGVNWASMLELAFRALSWTWAVEFFAAEAEEDPEPWLVDLLVALDRQLTQIEHNLSTYFSPNTHISGEALALYAVSQAFPELRRSRARAARGREILVREAAAQIRADGGHAELSSHYHRYSTDFYLLALLVARRTGDPTATVFDAALRAQAEYLRTIADDRGRLPRLGDDDGGELFRFGSAPAYDASATLAAAAEVLDDARLAVPVPGPEVCWILGAPPLASPSPPLAWPSRVLPDSGYVVSRANGGHLIFDAGPHGFLNGGHAHADALAVVLSVAGEPLFGDPGTATYTMDAQVRDRFRSAAMHNTITVNGRAFAEPRGPFHWSRHADARLLTTRISPDGDYAVGVHDGYGFAHVRAVLALPDLGWLIVDRLAPPAPVRVDAWWHLAPGWSATSTDPGFMLQHQTGLRLALATTAVERAIDEAPYSPGYGSIERAVVLRLGLMADSPAVLGTFVPARMAPGALPRLVLVDAVTARDGSSASTFSIATDTETIVTLTLAAPARVAEDWPQPCIQQPRALCVE